MVYIGTSGWAYPRWKGRFYPAELPSTRFLEYYATRLNAVEVNYTFCGRHVLRESVAERWLAQTPQNFIFAFRGPKPITHFHRHRLRDVGELVRRFETALSPFQRAERLGPVLFQLPATFPADPKILDDFLNRWPRELRVSFEFRNGSWFNDEVYAILRCHGVALCLAERDEMATPEIRTAAFAYLRLRKSYYPPAALQEVAVRIKRHARSGDVFAFFRQTAQNGALYAQAVARKLHVAG